ncbi:hypothetical protein [Pseudomonas frederiksbergensis]|uniref:hypothetical protein n=1 Tax=Pseudomonas frederiksbergensis TaxID=104087 RepID=UPI002181FE46|nr:hypothetical protein [Pseudomonas frederiksbergensis]
MSATYASGLFYEGDVGEPATIKFSGSRQSGDTGANNADFMLRISCLGDAIFLFNQCSIVEAQVGWIWKASRPFAFSRALGSNGFLCYE